MTRMMIALALTTCVVAAQSTQTLPNQFQGNNFATYEAPHHFSSPFSTGTLNWSSRNQYFYAPPEFLSPGPIWITDIAVRSDSNTAVGAFHLPSIEVRMSTAAFGIQTASFVSMDANYTADMKVVRDPRPWCSEAVPSTLGGPASFIKLGLDRAFRYDPGAGAPLMIEIRVDDHVVGWGSLDAWGWLGSGSYPSVSTVTNAHCCGNTSSGNSGQHFNSAPVIQITYGPNPEWQDAIPECAVRIDNGPAGINAVGPTRITRGSAQPLDLGLTTSLGNPNYNLAYDIGAVVPRSGGGNVSAFGQIVNVDLTSMSFKFLEPGFLDVQFPGVGGVYTIPALSPAAPLTMTAQMVVADVGHADGFRLSSAGQASWVPLGTAGAPVAGPTADRESVPVSVGAVRFFGQTYTEMFVGSEGQVSFGCGDLRHWASPTKAANGPPLVGLWTRFQPATYLPTGNASIEFPSAGVVRVVYTDFVTNSTVHTVPANFSITFDVADGSIVLDGIDTIPSIHPSYPMMLLGLTPGIRAGATDPGSLAFTSGGAGGAPANATDMIYEYGVAGAVASGVTTLTFMPAIVGGEATYTWSAL